MGKSEVQEVKKTSMNKKLLNLRAQPADIYMNGRILHEHSLFRLARHHNCVGLP